jgi:hypothetical protein
MTSRRVLLSLLFLAHIVFGALQAHFSSSDPIVNRVLLAYAATISLSLFVWAYLDARSAGRALTVGFKLAILVFGWWAMPFYIGATRAPGSRLRAFLLASLYFTACIGAYGYAFTWVLPQSAST